jgi:HK97 gp10 family phage protein
VAGSGFHFDTSHFKSPAEMERKLKRAVQANMQYWDGPIERWMKHNAPWKDRTTNARNGLFAKAQKAARNRFVIVLGHTVDYGIYLEAGTENMAARPIVRPALAMFAPKVIATLTKILDRL